MLQQALYLLLTIIIIGLIFSLLLFLARKIKDAVVQEWVVTAIYVVGAVALIIFLISLLPAAGHFPGWHT